MKINELRVGDSLLMHSEPEGELERIVPYGIQQLTQSEYNHVATYLGDGNCIGALAQGYTKETLQQAILKTDRVDVYRYHADADELTPDQQQKLVNWCLDHQGTPYDYLDIAFLAILCEINDTSWESLLLRKEFEFLIHVETVLIEDFVKANQELCNHIMGQAVADDKGLLICSQAGYLALTEGAGVSLAILNEDGRKDREKFYASRGSTVTLFKAANKQDLLTPNYSDFITPRDIAECDDLRFIDKLEI
jgi:Permuted papain-like amidase enzyme, YaeF/YiiX, C92 family